MSAGAERLEYAGRDFGGIGIDAVLEDGRLSGRIADRDEALRLALDLSGEVTRERQSVRAGGACRGVRSGGAGRDAGPDRRGAFGLDFRASASQEGTYAASLALDSIGIRNGYRTDRIRPTSVAVGADTASVRAEVRSGDFVLTLSAPASPDSLLAAAARASETLRRQLREQAFDMEELQDVLPRFRLQAEAGRNNILNNFLRTKGASFPGTACRRSERRRGAFVASDACGRTGRRGRRAGHRGAGDRAGGAAGSRTGSGCRTPRGTWTMWRRRRSTGMSCGIRGR